MFLIVEPDCTDVVQEKTDKDDIPKAVELNFIREVTLFSPVCHCHATERYKVCWSIDFLQKWHLPVWKSACD